MTTLLARSAIVPLLAVLAGCATLPPAERLPASHALEGVEDTALARAAAAGRPLERPGQSGFRLLPEGQTAFDARIALARRAERSLDVQVYVLADDPVGRRFLRELRDAARRGVRVRVLLDDLYTGDEETLLAGLAAVPGIEVRLFNPLPARGGSPGDRLLRSLPDFERVNHRMHNKLFVADNSVAISGGRNLAAEYFMRSPSANFIDLDVLATGPVVRELSRVFDDYWNSPQVRLARSVLAVAADEGARQRFDARVDAAPDVIERPRDVLGERPVSEQLAAGRLELRFGEARVFADRPDKASGSPSGPSVTQRTLELFATAQREVRIASPYFIPGERGLAMMRAAGATQENGRIVLLTNSLSSTDEPLAYAGYARYRVDLLRAGVRIFELGGALHPQSERFGSFGASRARLHAKVAVIDRRWLFVGSMNLDARSARANTEVGLVIDEPELAETMARFAEGTRERAYRLRLSPDGVHAQWVETDAAGEEIVYDEEPGVSAWQRWRLWLLAPFVPEALL
jgi:putative cardiolipin synthase